MATAVLMLFVSDVAARSFRQLWFAAVSCLKFGFSPATLLPAFRELRRGDASWPASTTYYVFGLSLFTLLPRPALEQDARSSG
jgi:hypothetical protein